MPDPNSTFEVRIEGRGALRVGPADYVATGGEGSVWRKGPTALKIWEDPARAIAGRMVEKVRLLSTLKHPAIVAPEAIASDARGRAVGYVMPWVEDGWAMPLAFTNDWRAANGFGDAEALSFAARMREVVTFVHGKGAIMGDANELNVLGVGRGAKAEPRYIDVDPWVLPGFPGDKILPTVRDWHAGPFTREADWFAWGVTTFQMITGIHPYRGTHPGFARNDIEGRMKANASVFDQGVRMPPSVRDPARIPPPLLEWYRAAFRDGFRGVPPDPGAAALPMPSAARRAGPPRDAKLAILVAFRLPAPLLREVAPDLLMLEGGALIGLPDGRSWGMGDPDASYARLADGSLLAAKLTGGRVAFSILQPGPGAAVAMADSGLGARAVWAAEGRLFAVVTGGLLELQARDLGARRVVLPGKKWSLNPDTTFWGNGLALHDALGAKFLVAPFGPSGVAMLRARELDGLTPVAAVRRGNVGVMSLIGRDGAYRRATLLFDATYGGCRITLADADDGSLDEAVTPTGVVVRFDHDGKLDLEVPASGARRVAAPGEAGTGRLVAGPSGVFAALPDRVLKLSMT